MAADQPGAVTLRVAALIAIASLLVACVGHSAAPVSSPRTGSPASLIFVNTVTDATFQPLSKVPHSALTPGEAWARFRKHARNKLMPAGMRVQYGKFSQGGAFLNRRVFAYSVAHVGCATQNPHYTPPPDVDCTFWTFLNPFTGRQLESTYQQVPPPS